MSGLKSNQNSFYTISKTAEIIGVKSHVLRFWEKKFYSINPKKSLSGRRYYSSDDIENLLMIKKLLYEEGFTIKGAVSIVDKKNKKDIKNTEENVNLKLTKSINLIQQGLNLIKKNIN
tara:strand:+ start:136 stop:489 length:354 start_codon:yes stop_codon:yes gene_type:complete